MKTDLCEEALRAAAARRRSVAGWALRAGDYALTERSNRVARQLELMADGLNRAAEAAAA